MAATKEIDANIRLITDNITEASSKAADVEDVLGTNREALAETIRSFDRIASIVSLLKDESDRINEKIDEMKVYKQEVMGVMDTILAASQEITASSEEVTASIDQQADSISALEGFSDRLEEDAVKLKEAMTIFRI